MKAALKIIEKLGLGETLSDADKASVSDELMQMLKERNKRLVEKYLDLTPDIHCVLLPADDDEEEQEETPNQEPEKDTIVAVR
ncbi:MAG: hypothetical protein HWE13_02975 [Gammaproteobacteria bacterium]|nr:hypothetical protein [Gammaproteobacteria bacterium]NVK87059.1 hypothetical protein [Gammaproteobacteria bacterium]